MLTDREYLLGEAADVSRLFYLHDVPYFLAQTVTHFDKDSLTAKLCYQRSARKIRSSFNAATAPFEASRSWSFPPAYPENPEYQVRIRFYGERTVRVQVCLSPEKGFAPDEASLMLNGVPKATGALVEDTERGVRMRGEKVSVELDFDPFCIRLYDHAGKLLTKTFSKEDHFCLQNCNPIPVSYVRTPDDDRKYAAFTFRAYPNEQVYGCGESFTGLNKRGQKVVLWTKDVHGVQTADMYKPIPFFMSSRGYGVFMHTSAPATFDFGHAYHEAHTLFTADTTLDMFLFAGDYRQVLGAYTLLTGRSPVPPLWSFGLWMSRITYKSEQEVREVAANLKAHGIPCDVIHLDTGWFEHDWQCDYAFSHTRFSDPKAMINDLKKDGYRICLWQLPYFTPKNRFYQELLDKGYAVKNADGLLPTDDAILDYSNPDAVRWYQAKLSGLLTMGVASVKADFGEAAPVTGQYHAGRSGLYEHNLYPLRYNAAAFEAVKESGGTGIIWARSAWAGSQRYPIHWGGDAENTDMGMLSSLRAGLSLGMSGFTFWSHDLGGFVRKSPEEIYRRWLFMGIFTSHMRCHGAPPKEPWAYSEAFLSYFRKLMAFRYSLTPYIYAQGQLLAKEGLPVMQPMCLAYPKDPACTQLEDQYLFGEDILVAPLFEADADARMVYLPKGNWIDLFDGRTVYQGGGYCRVPAGEWGGVALVRDGTEIPYVDAALTTDAIDWTTLRGHWYTSDGDAKKRHGVSLDKKTLEARRITPEAL